MRKTGAKKFYLPSADYIWPHTMNRKVRELVEALGGSLEITARFADASVTITNFEDLAKPRKE